jgi:hypothetical protein
MLLKKLQASLSEDNLMRVLYLTTSELGTVGSSGQCMPQDLSDANVHVIWWDTEQQELCVENQYVNGGKIEDLHKFLENRRGLWATLAELNRKTGNEGIIHSESVGSYLDKQGRWVAYSLWAVVFLLVIFLLLYYLIWQQPQSHVPPLSLPRVTPVYLKTSAL